MGRFYSGDIEGKFWFGSQSSDDADFFGSSGYQPSYLEYDFTKDHLPSIKKGLRQCKKQLGDYKAELDKFFDKREFYNNEELMKELKVTADKARDLLKWYARLELGEKIKKCVDEKGYCVFQAEI